MASVRVAYGTIVQELKEVPRSYQEAASGAGGRTRLLCRTRNSCV